MIWSSNLTPRQSPGQNYNSRMPAPFSPGKQHHSQQPRHGRLHVHWQWNDGVWGTYTPQHCPAVKRMKRCSQLHACSWRLSYWVQKGRQRMKSTLRHWHVGSRIRQMNLSVNQKQIRRENRLVTASGLRTVFLIPELWSAMDFILWTCTSVDS